MAERYHVNGHSSPSASMAFRGGAGNATIDSSSSLSNIGSSAQITSPSQAIKNAQLRLEQLIGDVSTGRDSPQDYDNMWGPRDSGVELNAEPSDDRDEPPQCYVQALYVYAGDDSNHLSFNAGDIIEVLGKEDTGWWDGILLKSQSAERGSRGWFPSNYVKRIINEGGYKINEELGVKVNEREVLNTDLDILFGRRGSTVSQKHIDRLLRSHSGEDENLKSFSSGGDVFEEIAAAAAAQHYQDLFGQRSSENDNKNDNVMSKRLQVGQGSQTGLLSAHQIIDKTPSPQDKHRPDGFTDGTDADWVPKVSSDGRIFYYNTRTGKFAAELPSPSSSSNNSRHKRTDPGIDILDSARYTSEGTSTSSDTHQQVSLTASSTLKAFPAFHSEPAEPITGGNLEEVLRKTILHVPNAPADSWLPAPQPSRAISMYSDESALDTAFMLPQSTKQRLLDITRTPRKISLTASNDSEIGTSLENSTAKLQALDPLITVSANSNLADLEKDCTESLNKLSEIVQRRASLTSHSSIEAEATEVADRHLFELVAISINNSTRRLLAATDVILEHPYNRRTSAISTVDPSPRSSLYFGAGTLTEQRSGSQELAFRLPALSLPDFRPLAMKITATESKLILSLRTNWGLLSTSAAEERAVEASREADSLPEEEKHALKKQRQVLLTARREIDEKMRFDLLIQIRTLGNAISAFVSEVEIFARKKGMSSEGYAMVTPKRVDSELRLSYSELLLPVSYTSGGLRGHGFSRTSALLGKRSRPSSFTPSFLQFPQSIRSSHTMTAGEPDVLLSSYTLQNLETERNSLRNELQSLQSFFATTVGSALAEKPLDSSLLPSITSQTFVLLKRLASFLREIEQVDIAARLDIDLNPETFASLSGETIQGLFSKGIFPVDAGAFPANATYQNSLRRAASLLERLLIVKQSLYVVPPILLAAVQSLSAVKSPVSQVLNGSMAARPMQPASSSPLSSLSPLKLYTHMNEPIIQVLAGVENGISSLINILSSLSLLADEQASASPELRRSNLELRKILAQKSSRASVVSSSPSQSLYVDQRKSMTAGLGLEDENAGELESPREEAASPDELNGQPVPSLRGDVDQTILTPSSGSQGRETLPSSYRKSVRPRPSRSNSMADSFSSELSGTSSAIRRDEAEEVRIAMHAAGISSPTNHSPSKSKLKQFFGTDAPGQNIRRAHARDTPSFLQEDFLHSEITYSSDGSIRAGTIHALICRLTNHMSADPNYSDTFLMMYRTFMTSSELLDRLVARYYVEEPPDIGPEELILWTEQKQKLIRIRVNNVIRSWVTDYYYDDEESILLDEITSFAISLPGESSQQILRLVERRKKTGMPRRLTASLSGGTMPAPIVPRNLRKIKFLDVDALEIARQFTILDSKLFAKITAEECLSKAWPKKFKNNVMPNFRAIADMSNLVTGWVAMSVVTQPDVRRRAAIIKHFIAIADKCRQLSNFTTLMQIVAGLNSGAIYRLKRTWELVNQRSMSTLTFLGNLMSPENNHALYRDALRLVGSPCVPFLGVYFTDWVMSGEANSDMLRDKPDQINFAKRARVAESIQQIQLNQATPYSLTSVPALVKWIEDELRNARSVSEGASTGNQSLQSTPAVIDPMQRAYDFSLKIEPREREDERIARLLSESGFL